MPTVGELIAAERSDMIRGIGKHGGFPAVAEQLGLNEGALKAAIHRLRQRFRALVKAQIEQTVSTDDELRDELRYLIRVVS